MEKEKFYALLDRYLAGKSSQEEEQLLLNLYESYPEEEWDKEALGTIQELEDKIHRRLQQTISQTIPKPQVTTLPSWKKIAAVFAVIIVGGGLYLWINGLNNKVEVVQNKEVRFPNDIPPGGNKAMLTLSDGSHIILDEAQNGALAKQGNSLIKKAADGQLVYDVQETDLNLFQAEIPLNTIATPRGGQYQVALPDGSKVWLNAESSIRFPATFTEKVRMVELTGEAYFEVAPDKSTPFHVKLKGVDIIVLGTHFNVMAYANEDEIKTTLIEGKVKVEKNNESRLLEPGQQAKVKNSLNPKGIDPPGSQISIIQADVEEAVAWKNGDFYFNSTDLKSIMRQLERWYDVEVNLKGLPDKKFNGIISRDVNLSQVLKMLELTSTIHFRIEGRRITFMD